MDGYIDSYEGFRDVLISIHGVSYDEHMVKMLFKSMSYEVQSLAYSHGCNDAEFREKASEELTNRIRKHFQ